MKVELLKLLVKPNSLENSVEGIFNGIIKIKIKSVPEKGKANKELINFISEKLKISKTRIKIISGKNSNLKLIEIIKDNDNNIASLLLNG